MLKYNLHNLMALLAKYIFSWFLFVTVLIFDISIVLEIMCFLDYSPLVAMASEASSKLASLLEFDKELSSKIVRRMGAIQHQQKVHFWHLKGAVDTILANKHIMVLAKMGDYAPFFRDAAEYCYANGAFNLDAGFFRLSMKLSLTTVETPTGIHLDTNTLSHAFAAYCRMCNSYNVLISSKPDGLTLTDFQDFWLSYEKLNAYFGSYEPPVKGQRVGVTPYHVEAYARKFYGY